MVSVAQWYSGKRIFITGGTGFMGKILIEKLLRSCPEIAAVYLLIRPKREKSPTQRIEEYVNSPIFDKIRDLPDGVKRLQKLQCISGDVTQNTLDLSNDDLQLLQDTVEVVFHMAANVRFDQSLKPAMLMNLGGTLRVLELALTFKKLKAFVHTSTTYCHCDQTVLEEKMYPAPHSPRKMLDLVQWMDEDLIKLLTPRLLKNSPNTYAYTKCLTEQLVMEYGRKLPLAIARPSIVTAVYKEPIPGWVDNLNGPTGLLVGAGKGVIRTMHCNPSLTADLIPVDISINGIILIAKEVGQRTEKLEEPLVYHLTADAENAITWGEALDLGRKHFFENPFSICLWYPGGSIKSSYVIHMLAAFFFHLVPAYFIDFVLTVCGKKPFLIRTQKRIQNGLEVLQYYTTRPWRFLNDNIKNVAAKLNEHDKQEFCTDMSSFNWDHYILTYVLGARKYCVHEEPETIPYAKKVLKRLYYLDLATNVIMYSGLLWLVYVYWNTFFGAAEYMFACFTSHVIRT